jgi:integrase/recombinase XerD
MNTFQYIKIHMGGMGGGLAKQAKRLTDRQIKRALAEVGTHRNAERDRVMVLLSVKAGLRTKEIAMVTWGMVNGRRGQRWRRCIS